MGRVRHADSVLTRVHSESMLSDLFGAARCDSGSQLDAALAGIGARGSGVLVYLRGQQGRGLPLAEELQAHATAEAEACENAAVLDDATFPVGGACSVLLLRTFGPGQPLPVGRFHVCQFAVQASQQFPFSPHRIASYPLLTT